MRPCILEFHSCRWKNDGILIILNDCLSLYVQPNSEVHIHWKGAAEIILASCTRYIDSDDQVAAMDDDKVGFYSKQLVVLQ